MGYVLPYNQTGRDINNFLYPIYNQNKNETRGAERSIHIDYSGECNSISKGTAYDLLIENYSGVVAMKKDNIGRQNIQNVTIEKLHNIFITMFLALSMGLIIMSLFEIEWIDKKLIMLGVFMFLSGAVGMYIDKVCWRSK